jgi:hypothetical protein
MAVGRVWNPRKARRRSRPFQLASAPQATRRRACRKPSHHARRSELGIPITVYGLSALSRVRKPFKHQLAKGTLREPFPGCAQNAAAQKPHPPLLGPGPQRGRIEAQAISSLIGPRPPRGAYRSSSHILFDWAPALKKGVSKLKPYPL